jgi:hypothetical protein
MRWHNVGRAAGHTVLDCAGYAVMKDIIPGSFARIIQPVRNLIVRLFGA